MVLVEGVGDLALGPGHRENVEGLGDQRAQQHLAARGHQPPQPDIADRAQLGVDQHDVIELLGQIVGRAQVVDRLADVPVLGGHHHLPLHQAAGGVLRIGQRLLDGDPVAVLEHLEDRLLLGLVEILEQVDHVIGFEFAHRVGQHLGVQGADHLLADRLVKLGQDVAVEFLAVELDQPHPVEGVDLLEKVGDVGRVQRLHQLDELLPLAGIDGKEDRCNVPRLQRVGVLLACVGVFDGLFRFLGHRCSAACRLSAI